MNLDILSQNLLLYVCIIFTVVVVYLASGLYKAKPTHQIKSRKAKLHYLKLNRAYFVGALGLAIILSLILDKVIGRYSQTDLPTSFILMCLPFTGLLSLLAIAVFYKKKLILACSLSLVIGLVFSLLIINNYYRFYPTLGEVFGQNNVKSLDNEEYNVTLNYSVSTKQTTLNQQSIQGSLDKLSGISTSGNLYKINIPGTISKFKARDGYVYIPAIYKSLAQINLPVLVLTAGWPGTPDNWPGLGLENIMNQFAKNHNGITPLVFVADNIGSLTNDTECVNSPRGNVETYLTVDVPNFIKHNFHVDSSPSNWAIGGLSLGGMCAIMLTLRHPDVYNYFMDLGGELGPEDGPKQHTIDTLFDYSEAAWAAHQPSLLLASHHYDNIGGFFGDGDQDTLNVEDAIAQLSAESKKAGIQSITETIVGAHTFNVWAETFKDALPWLSNRVGATQCSSSCL